MAPAVDAVIKRSDAAWAVKSGWEAPLRDAFEFALPMRNTYTTQHKGAPKMDRVFDSTAIHSTMRFSGRLQQNLTPPFQNWTNLEAGPLVPEDAKPQVTAKLQTIQKQLFAAIHVSNFDMTIAEYYMDLASGTAGMMVLEGDDENPLNFIAVPNAQLAIDEGPNGGVDGVFRKHKMKIRNIDRTWSDAKLPDAVKTMEKDDPEAEINLCEATYFDKKTKQYRYEVIWKADDKKKGDPTRLVERTYEDHPWIITRWIKAPGEVWGRGPLLIALPDIKTLNKVKELILKNASLAIAGVWAAADDGVINPATIKIVPGAVIPVAQAGNLQPLEFGGRFDVAQLVIEDLTMNIKQMLFDRALPPETGQPRSATEIIERMKELQQDIGAPFGRMMSELIRPLIQRCLNILHRKGIVELPVKVNGLTVQITATSPLARLQKMNDLENVVQWLQLSQSVGEQAYMGGVKVEDIPEYMGEQLGVDAKLMRSKQERAQLQQMMGQMAGQGAIDPAAVGGGGIPTGGQGPQQIAA